MRAIDANIWLYALIPGQDAEKAKLAEELLAQPGKVVSTQIINEVCVNLRRKAGLSEDQLFALVEGFYDECLVVELGKACLLQACGLRSRYGLSFWDSLVVATALAAGCDTLYSEDMHDGLTVDGTLVIINPFRTK